MPAKDSREEASGTQENLIYHTILLDDAHSGLRFGLGHTGDSKLERFKENDALIAKTFRILLPGTAVPVP